MTQGPYFVGIDGGTESVRVGIFGREGTSVVFAGEPYSFEHPRPGWTEQDPDESAHEEYQFYVDRYVETYPQVKELMHETVRHVASGEGRGGGLGSL